jgi:hypothetical protein
MITEALACPGPLGCEVAATVGEIGGQLDFDGCIRLAQRR